MPLLVNEQVVQARGELLLTTGPLRVWCQITAEWLRGITEPTWYGYFVPTPAKVRILPGRHQLRLADGTFMILVRHARHLGDETCFPFWGLGIPPTPRAGRLVERDACDQVAAPRPDGAMTARPPGAALPFPWG